MCWLTSAVIVSVLPSDRALDRQARSPISGRASGGNSTSMTGPVIVRIRPSAFVPFFSAGELLFGYCHRWLPPSAAAVGGLGQSASAPPMTSMISVVISACRAWL